MAIVVGAVKITRCAGQNRAVLTPVPMRIRVRQEKEVENSRDTVAVAVRFSRYSIRDLPTSVEDR